MVKKPLIRYDQPLNPPLLGDKKESLRDTLRLSAGGILHLFF
jgi:hypothetical protein